MKIAVVGTGALGSLYAGYLARSGQEVYAIDIREDIITAIRNSGIRIVEPEGTEVDFINGAIVREGERLGIDTPVNRTITNLVRAIEKTYDLRA
jgi:2-dehydropantoate 2-reductase